VAACGEAHFQPCAVACGALQACPSGLTCSVDGFCHQEDPATYACSPVSDAAAADASDPIGMDADCGLPGPGFSDAFDDAAPSSWATATQIDEGRVWVANGLLVFEIGGPAPSTDAGPGLDRAMWASKKAFDITNRAVVVEVVQPIIRSGTRFSFELRTGDGDYAQIRIVGGMTPALESIIIGASAFTVVFDAARHRWWRIRESAGTLSLEASPDGVDWIALSGGPSPAGGEAVVLELEAAETSPGERVSGSFDNLNLAPCP
jgi:hypothetical protein